MRKLLQKLRSWFSRDKAAPHGSLPNSGPNVAAPAQEPPPDPFAIDTSETPEEKRDREERQKELLDKYEREVEEEAAKPPPYDPAP
jgi:hypothetical protein